MRPVLLGDVTAAARALLRVAPAERAALLTRWLDSADAADRYARKLRKVHPVWGNGTLKDALGLAPLAAEPYCSDPEYCSCLSMVLHGLAARRGGRDHITI